MNQAVFDNIARSKIELEKEGLKILGIFGSYAKETENPQSDVDILIETTERFIEKNGGFGSMKRLAEIKQAFEKALNKSVDMADINGLNPISKAHILSELVYV
jgi:hypothetical protein